MKHKLSALFTATLFTLAGCNAGNPTSHPGGGMVACTQEAMLCPDGKTAVGRSGPHCEFAPCPTSAAKMP